MYVLFFRSLSYCGPNYPPVLSNERFRSKWFGMASIQWFFGDTHTSSWSYTISAIVESMYWVQATGVFDYILRLIKHGPQNPAVVQYVRSEIGNLYDMSQLTVEKDNSILFEELSISRYFFFLSYSIYDHHCNQLFPKTWNSTPVTHETSYWGRASPWISLCNWCRICFTFTRRGRNSFRWIEEFVAAYETVSGSSQRS